MKSNHKGAFVIVGALAFGLGLQVPCKLPLLRCRLFCPRPYPPVRVTRKAVVTVAATILGKRARREA